MRSVTVYHLEFNCDNGKVKNMKPIVVNCFVNCAILSI